MSLEKFKMDCNSEDPNIIVQKYLLDGNSYFFSEIEDSDEFTFKKNLSDALGVHLREIVIVGSGKLGFSVKPDKDEPGYYPFLKFDEKSKSDLDIAIVSPLLFDSQLRNIYQFTGSYTKSEIWRNNTHRNGLAKYILKGWLKPDLVPQGYEISRKINEFRSNYKMKFGRDINIGIYKSWFYLENYHHNNIKNIQLNIIANG